MQTLFDYFAGVKTYLISLVGISTTAAGMYTGQIQVTQGLEYCIAFFIVCAIRSAMKTERGKMAEQVGEQVAQKVVQLLKEPNSPQIDVEKVVEAVRQALITPPTPPQNPS